MGASPSGARAAPSASSSPAVAASAHAHAAARRVLPSRPPTPPPPPQNYSVSTAVARCVLPTRPPPPPPPPPQNYSVSTAAAAAARRVVPTRPPPPPPPQINYFVSTAAAARSSGHHVFRIRDYSLLKAITPNGKSIKSTSFVVGGHSWHVEYYPNGYDTDHADYVSVFLVLEGGGTGEPVNVQLRFRFVDALSNPGRLWPPPSEANMRGEKVRDFDGQGNGWGNVAFKKKEKLEVEGIIVEDGLAIRCDIVVITQSCTETTTTTTTTTEASAAAAAVAFSIDVPPTADPRPRTKIGEEMFSPIKGVNPVYAKWCSPPLFQ